MKDDRAIRSEIKVYGRQIENRIKAGKYTNTFGDPGLCSSCTHLIGYVTRHGTKYARC